ncbi:MAG TPA: alpha-1,4-glucan--maltose-1-phosphate maltosyltransferase [Terriglobia bacterium]|nr:alpha-1,4-glucan--maltose-1-phosphate maltosyltransferase [Terriglobia bacterium]
MSGRQPARVVIQHVKPEIDCGRFPIKRVIGETVGIEADIFADGHDSIACAIRYRHEDDEQWTEIPMEPLGNDHWRAPFAVEKLGQYIYSITAWPDPFQTWYKDFQKRIAADQDVTVDLLIGAELLKAAAERALGADAKKLRHLAKDLTPAAVDERLALLATSYADRSNAAVYRELRVTVDPIRARFSTWYELFPRSHGTFKDCERILPEIAAMGFDVLYFPPIHPIGESFRKGKNNAPKAGPSDPGSPWGIGAKEGGHKAVHPELGTLEDFRHLVAAAKIEGISIALDLAYQCSPDHPYVKQHPEWFRWRPDGTVQYAENPPKKYQDIYPLEFETGDWRALWEELKSVVEFWIEQGVRIFRVDNPHTKPFDFWEWMIRDLKKKHPDLIFLSEAFTRPNIMYRLAKLGFTQSYTYFTWRNTKRDIIEYFTELTQTEVREYFRPNLWPNTPDILHEYLQKGGRQAFMARVVLAATLGANYGIYGPAYELGENVPKEPGSEEYLNSEKYEIKHRDLHDPSSLRPLITKVNAIRKQNPSLQSNESLQFHNIENEQMICYSKRTPDRKNAVVTIVNLDPFWKQSGFVELPLDELGIDVRHPYRMVDLLTGAEYRWQGPRNYVELQPNQVPAHILSHA